MSPVPVPEIAFAVGMTAAAISDLRYRWISKGLHFAVLLGGLGARAILGGPTAMAVGLLGAAVALGVLVVPFHYRWIAGGDVKLMIAAGAWLGPRDVLWALLWGLALGGLLSVIVLLAGGRELRADVRRNLQAAALSLSAPAAPRRARRQLVPMAVALGAAAVGVLVYRGGLHV